MLESDNFDISIVGGGTIGSVLASILSEKGLDVVLLEKRIGEVEPAKHGIGLQPNGLEALHKIGALDDVLKIGERSSTNTIYDERRDKLVTIDLRETGHPYPYFLSVTPDKLTTLFRKRLNKARLVEGFEVQSLVKEGNIVRGIRGKIRTKMETQEGEEEEEKREFRAKVVVGADGPFSKVRSLAGFEYKVKKYNDHYVASVLPGAMPNPEFHMIIGRGTQLGVLPLKGNFTYFFWYVEKKGHEEIIRSDVQSFKRRLGLLDPSLKPVLEGLEDWSQTIFIAPVGVFLPHWVLPGVALIGDSAHAMNPALGQGMNQSLLDVIALSQVLDECYKQDNFSYEMLERYEQMRYKRALFIQKQSELTALVLSTNSRLQSFLGRRILKKAAEDKKKRALAAKLGAGLLESLSLTDRLSLLL
jgi:2-polyprenyl-6-methoxyphenol hydroxylase-like FAD-dependent oxidoreductase